MTAAPDPKKVEAFMWRFVQELGAVIHAPTVLIGDKLGLYRALADREGGLTAEELASATRTEARLLRDWLGAQVAAGYVEYDRTSKKFWMTPEQKFVLVDPSGPDLGGAFLVLSSVAQDWRKIAEAYRGGKGFGWNEHHADLFEGTSRFFRPGYAMNLLPAWLPALEGVIPKLERGAKVADLGCGHGSSTILLGQAFPKSTIVGIDYHAPSIAAAREHAKAAGVGANVSFEVATGDALPGSGYDLVCIFDALHDMGDPAGAAKRIRSVLKPDGTWLLVEPFANEAYADNFTPMGRVFFGASSMICAMNALAQGGKEVLGAQAPESALRAITHDAGFTRFRLALATPVNRIFEVRP